MIINFYLTVLPALQYLTLSVQYIRMHERYQKIFRNRPMLCLSVFNPTLNTFRKEACIKIFKLFKLLSVCDSNFISTIIECHVLYGRPVEST